MMLGIMSNTRFTLSFGPGITGNICCSIIVWVWFLEQGQN